MAVRGQAFETMMLVISVIVALAILGVLTGIIGNLQFGASSSPQEAMHDQIKNIATAGYGYSEPVKILIKKGTKIDSRAILKNDLPQLNADKVRFCIDSSIPSGSSTGSLLPLDVTTACTTSSCVSGAKIIGPATQDVSAYFVACGNTNIGDRGAFRIGIATNAKAASTVCTIPDPNASGC